MSTSAKLILGAYGVAVASYVLLVSAALITGGRTTLVSEAFFDSAQPLSPSSSRTGPHWACATMCASRVFGQRAALASQLAA